MLALSGIAMLGRHESLRFFLVMVRHTLRMVCGDAARLKSA
jgi:hypothetical protein